MWSRGQKSTRHRLPVSPREGRDIQTLLLSISLSKPYSYCFREDIFSSRPSILFVPLYVPLFLSALTLDAWSCVHNSFVSHLLFHLTHLDKLTVYKTVVFFPPSLLSLIPCHFQSQIRGSNHSCGRLSSQGKVFLKINCKPVSKAKPNLGVIKYKSRSNTLGHQSSINKQG